MKYSKGRYLIIKERAGAEMAPAFRFKKNEIHADKLNMGTGFQPVGENPASRVGALHTGPFLLPKGSPNNSIFQTRVLNLGLETKAIAKGIYPPTFVLKERFDLSR